MPPTGGPSTSIDPATEDAIAPGRPGRRRRRRRRRRGGATRVRGRLGVEPVHAPPARPPAVEDGRPARGATPTSSRSSRALDNGKPVRRARATATWRPPRSCSATSPAGRRRSRARRSRCRARPAVPRLHAARADRRRRRHRAVELPAGDGVLQDRPGAHGGQHRRPQARRADPAERAAPRRAVPRGGAARGRRQRRPRASATPVRRSSAHLDVDKVAFTGSTEVGKKIVAAAAGNLKKVSLELGGKAPNIVFADADLEEAIAGSAHAAFFNQGQCCVNGSRLYVQRGVFDEVVEGISRIARGIKVGQRVRPERPTWVRSSPTSSTRRSCGYLAAGVAEGATVAAGGDRVGERGYFVRPTVFTDVSERDVDPAGRDLRPGRHGGAVRHRRRGGRAREQHPLRPRRRRLVARHRHGPPGRRPPARRHGVAQHLARRRRDACRAAATRSRAGVASSGRSGSTTTPS